MLWNRPWNHSKSRPGCAFTAKFADQPRLCATTRSVTTRNNLKPKLKTLNCKRKTKTQKQSQSTLNLVTGVRSPRPKLTNWLRKCDKQGL